MKKSILVLAIATEIALPALADPQFVDQTDATRLTCVGCSSNNSSFGYRTYAGQSGLVTTAQISQAKENAVKEYLTSSQAPKDAALAAAHEAIEKQRAGEKIIGKIEIRTVVPKQE